jgi:urease accessory protein
MNTSEVSALLPRVNAELRLEAALAGARTQAFRAYDSGGWRWRFPRATEICEAVIVNTGGGMAGGDRARVDVVANPGACLLVTSQSQEKIYRAAGLACQVRLKLTATPGARLIWAPQETLLFEGARLARRLEADVADDASLTIYESAAFGRLAHGETRVDASLHDVWRLRRGGRLVFAEALGIDDAGATLDRLAVGAGARGLATLVRIAPDAAARLDPLREALAQASGLEAGASVVDGVLVARLASASPQRLRAGLAAAFLVLEGRAPPRVWS